MNGENNQRKFEVMFRYAHFERSVNYWSCYEGGGTDGWKTKSWTEKWTKHIWLRRQMVEWNLVGRTKNRKANDWIDIWPKDIWLKDIRSKENWSKNMNKRTFGQYDIWPKFLINPLHRRTFGCQTDHRVK